MRQQSKTHGHHEDQQKDLPTSEKESLRVRCELTPELVFLHLSEEVGEIARQLVNKNLAIREYDEGNLKEEIVQAMLDLFVLSEVNGIDLPTALTGKIKETARRQRNLS